LTPTTWTRLTRRPRKAMTRTYLPGEEKEALLCLYPHHKDEADQEAQERNDEDPAHDGQAPLHALHHEQVQL